MSRSFAAGERVLLADSRGRRYLVTLRHDGQFHTHTGVVDHAQLIGRSDGVAVRSTAGTRFVATRPTLADTVLKMPRGAQVIYPKDLGAILIAADVFPGARIVEAGVGSGALSMALLRAGAIVFGYETRPDFARRASENVAAFLGSEVPYTVSETDVCTGISDTALDRIVLDLPEPWSVVAEAERRLRSGGILVSFLPTINQVAELTTTLGRSRFELVETVEVLHRSWHVTGRSVRPDHRMVAHTGFITSARLIAFGEDGSGA